MKSDDAVKNQWNRAAESWAFFVRSGKNYYSEYFNGPALKRMIGKAEGKTILDIGCGEGCFSRFYATEGAKVTAVDISEEFIKKAAEEEKRSPLGIEYFAADAADLNMLESESFDVAFCYMALMDIQGYEGAIAEASRVLKAGGRFVVLLEHPCFTAYRVLDGKKISGWETRVHEDGSKTYPYYWIEDYFHRHSYVWKWEHERLPSSFVTTGFHRTLSDYVNALAKNGLAITRMEEPQPTDEGIKVHPPMKKHLRVPQSIAIEAIKLPTCGNGRLFASNDIHEPREPSHSIPILHPNPTLKNLQTFLKHPFIHQSKR